MIGAGRGMLNRIIGFPLMALALTACVTINIYFPAAAAEEAARTIVRDVLKSEPQEPAPPAKPDEKQSYTPQGHPLAIAFGVMMEALVAPAQAAQADININTAAISAIRASMQKRQSSLAPRPGHRPPWPPSMPTGAPGTAAPAA